ncbi:MAG: class I SAM-dependent methyltransferase [Anaerolineales bacterium]|nr:class I SAM-dependent methyltransferase [Anaerolineales bacterium]
MDYKSIFYPESRFGGFSNVDGTIAFYQRVNSLIDLETIVIDVGCGRGAYQDDPIPYRKQLRELRHNCSRVIGIDVDPSAKDNPFVDEFRPITTIKWPIDDESAGLCLVDNVLEHIEIPEMFFSECYRILKPGGYLCIRTPNLLSYVGLIARIVPNRQHVAVLQKAKDRVSERDVFPTYYRCNTIPTLRKTLQRFNFDACVYGYESEPAYLSFSKITYALGVVLGRITPNLFRIGIHAFARKQRREGNKPE